MSARFRIGTSGWHYKHWRGNFYPEHLAPREWLKHYAGQFDTVELNNSFYRLPKDEAWASWRIGTPEGFSFSVKASRYITHIERLDVKPASIERFLKGALLLRDRLGPLLYQLPPTFHRNEGNFARLEEFLALLPKDRTHAFEFRHDSWFTEPVFDLLEKHRAAFCAFDAPDLKCPLRLTGGVLYLRFHGTDERYGGNYSDAQLETWARRIREAAEGASTAFIYFNNDAGGFAPKNALTLRRFLSASIEIDNRES